MARGCTRDAALSRQEAGARRRTGPERMPEAPRRKPSARARRPAPPAWRDRLPTLEQRHWDLIGLGLVALAVFLALLIYLGWDGGEIGAALVDGLRRGLGAVHHVVPVALLAAGVVVVMRPVLPAVRPFRAAAACLFAGTTLGLAAGTLGVGTGPAEERGGLVGEGLLEVASTLLGTVGAHIVAVFFLLAGVLLLTGASVASVVKATGDSVSTTGRRLRAGTAGVGSAVVARRRTAREELQALEAAGGATAVTRRSAPASSDFWSGAERFPDFYEGSAEVEPAEPAPEPAARACSLSPSPRSRASPRTPTRTSPASRAPRARSRRRT